MLRNALAAIENAEALVVLSPSGEATELPPAPAGPAEVERRVVTDLDARAVVAGEIDELRAAAEQYRTVGQEEAPPPSTPRPWSCATCSPGPERCRPARDPPLGFRA